MKKEYSVDFRHINLRDESIKLLNYLAKNSDNKQNKEELSLNAGIKRSTLDKVLLQLETLCFVRINNSGKSKVCILTNYGKTYYNWFQERGK